MQAGFDPARSNGTGLTPARYLWKFRVERGVVMLAETGHTLAEIAYRCGFRNPFHFSRLVKQQLRLSPKALRDWAWNSAGTPSAEGS